MNSISNSGNNTDELRMIWIDLEMTGLDCQRDDILEIAVIVTDANLNELATGPVLAIRTDEHRLLNMDDWNRRTHQKSGLWQRALESDTELADAQQQVLTFLRDWVVPGTSPMCGNSICQDRRFLARQMPELEAYFHYRNLDVSTLKELCRRWSPHIFDDYYKESRHEALSDIRDSIAELQYYRGFMGEFSGTASRHHKTTSH
jgi:oligoribonuclease